MPLTGKVSSYFLQQISGQTAGCVHSVFRTSANVRIGKFLVHLGAADSPLSCLGLSIDTGRMAEILSAIRPGDLAVCRAGTLRIYDREGVSFVPYAGLTAMDLAIEPGGRPGAKLLELLQQMELPDRIGLAMDKPLCDALAVLRSGNLDREALRAAIEFFIGRGKGLTPSGDDILMGFGAGLQAWGSPGCFCAVLREALRQQTTDISIAYLTAMLDGYVNEDYRALFDAVRDGREENYGELLTQISHRGHTSGCDSLLGLLTAVQAVLGTGQTD